MGRATAAVWMERHEFWNRYVNDDLLPKDSTWLKILDLLQFYIISIVGTKQLCALAHLGCTRKEGTS